MEMTNAMKKMIKARTGLVMDDMAFFSTLALKLDLVEDASEDNPTAWTDGVTLGFNPQWIESLEFDYVKGVICHEVMHNALQHNLRQGERDHEQWNEAADYAINGIIEDEGMRLPPSRLRNPAFDGLEAESIYGKLGNRPKNKDGNAGGKDGKGKDKGQCGTVRPYPGKDGKGKPTPADINQQIQDQKIDLQNAIAAGKRAGNLPAGIEQLVKEILEPVIPWREVLARFIDTHSSNDYDWTMPSKRYIHTGIYLPRLQNPELGHIGIYDDTSGSHFSAEQQRMALSEIRGIVESYPNAKATVIFVDTKVQGEPVELNSDWDIQIPKPKGGGGTDFKPPFDYVEEHQIEIKAAIYITDGECNSFPHAPDYDTLWLLTERNDTFNPPFGEVICMV